MYKQVFDPIGDSLGLSSMIAALPLLTLFVLLGGFRLKAHISALAALAVALLVAIIGYGMPAAQALDVGLEGAAFGLFPIMWIVFNALWIYRMTEQTGHFAVLRRSFATVSDDQRIQAIIVAFCFGALLEALAGFGTPVAITSMMLIALGLQPIKAAAVALVANTAPVAFGAMAVPIITLGTITEIPKEDLGAMVGHQTPLLAVFVPLILVGMVDGRRGIRETWPAAIVGGSAFAIGQFISSNYLSVELTDIVAALAGAGAVVALLRVWQPAGATAKSRTATAHPAVAGAAVADLTWEDAVRRRQERTTDSRAEVFAAYAPYLVIIAIFAFAQWNPVKNWMALHGATEFSWPGLDILNAKGEAPGAATFKLGWAPAAGTLLLLAGLISMAILRVSPGRAARVYVKNLHALRWATVTVVSVLALAYVMNLSGQTQTIGLWIAGAGGFVAFLSPIIGWLGVAVTGSDTSSNSLFGALQVAAAKEAGLSPTLLAAANTSGGVLGKMISPQNLAIGVAAVGLAGQEGVLLRKVIGWSLVLLLVMCVLVYLQSTPLLSWMVV